MGSLSAALSFFRPSKEWALSAARAGGLARPGICDRLLRHFRGFIIHHKHLPPVFEHEKGTQLFSQAPMRSPSFFAKAQNTARSLGWAGFCARLLVRITEIW